MISAFKSLDNTFHAARHVSVSEITVRQGIQGILTRQWWEPLCSVGLINTEMAPCAAITCLECREVLIGSN